MTTEIKLTPYGANLTPRRFICSECKKGFVINVERHLQWHAEKGQA